MSTPTALAGAALAASVLTLAGCAGPRAAQRPPALVGRAVSIAAPDLAGREVRVAPGGAALTVVDFWATWCAPCREQLPALDRLAARYRDRGVAVYAVSFDEDGGEVEAFLSERPVGFPVLWDAGGAALSGPLEITRLPTTLVIDRAGVVRAVHLGFDGRSERALDAEIGRLSEEVSPARR